MDNLKKCPFCQKYYWGDACPDCNPGSYQPLFDLQESGLPLPILKTCPSCSSRYVGDKCPNCNLSLDYLPLSVPKLVQQDSEPLPQIDAFSLPPYVPSTPIYREPWSNRSAAAARGIAKFVSKLARALSSSLAHLGDGGARPIEVGRDPMAFPRRFWATDLPFSEEAGEETSRFLWTVRALPAL